MAITTITLMPVVLLAEDFPVAYLGPGSLEYLYNRIQNGYYVETFTKIDLRQKERVNKRNLLEEVINTSSDAMPQSSDMILGDNIQHKEETDIINDNIAKQRQQRIQAATAQGEFTYIPHSNGRIDYFTDGLVSRIENERFNDEFGNESRKDTLNIKYDDRRLMISSQANVRDNLGNISQVFWSGQYTADSVFYGSDDTNANKNLLTYITKEIDHAGNEKITSWRSLGYEGKFVKAYAQIIDDSIYGKLAFTRSKIVYEGSDKEKISSYHEDGIGTDGLGYSLDRNKITYNHKSQMTSYHEYIETRQLDGTVVKTTSDATLSYISSPKKYGDDVEDEDPDLLSKTEITTTTVNADGSFKSEMNRVSYNYDINLKLVSSSGRSDFIGKEANWYEYSDNQGRILTREVDDNGMVTYSYFDKKTQETILVDPIQVKAALKEGNTFRGSSLIKYDILFGRAMVSQSDSLTLYYHSQTLELLRTDKTTTTNTNGLVNNIQKILSSAEHTESTFIQQDELGNPETATKDTVSDYIYAENGNLSDMVTKGSCSGYEFTDKGWSKYSGDIEVDNDIILGRAMQKHYRETRDYEVGQKQVIEN